MQISKLFSTKLGHDIWIFRTCNWSLTVFICTVILRLGLIIRSINTYFEIPVKIQESVILLILSSWVVLSNRANRVKMNCLTHKSVVLSSFRHRVIFTFCLHAPIPMKIGKRHGKLERLCSQCRRDWRCRCYKKSLRRRKLGHFFPDIL